MKNHNQKRKIVNDPVYGFIDIPSGIIYDLIQHPYFQRLRRIRQLGLTFLIYPGANHNRLQHALGAMHLMNTAIEVIRSKGHDITPQEEEAVKIAILLHDIGHGPFSHTLENHIITNLSHEQISEIYMDKLNEEFSGALSLAIQIFKDKYSKKFLHQLVSSQLDMDRLDYLRRDSFFTGVSEGVVGSDRIIKMLDVCNDHLVVEVKGIYSIEKFLIARRLMYWQVYLHKTVVAADVILLKIIKRAKDLINQGVNIDGMFPLIYFMKNNVDKQNFISSEINQQLNTNALKLFSELDDNDIFSTIKMWVHHPDYILSSLSQKLLNRDLFKIIFAKEEFPETIIKYIQIEISNQLKISINEAAYFIETNDVSNHAYSLKDDKINILYKDGRLKDIADASDISNVRALSKKVVKYYLCFPKNIDVDL